MRYALRSKTSQVPAVGTLSETLRDTYSPAGQGTCMCQQPGSLPDSHTIYCSQKRKPSLKYIKGSKINNLDTVKVYSRIKLPKRSCWTAASLLSTLWPCRVRDSRGACAAWSQWTKGYLSPHSEISGQENDLLFCQSSGSFKP